MRFGIILGDDGGKQNDDGQLVGMPGPSSK